MNQHHLRHNTFTDILTFDLSENPEILTADIFISVDRVRENAKKFDVKFDDELHRVMIHGILHLLGYSDKTKKESLQMRAAEDECLKQLKINL
jgi:rRNA maturation RNase YbeY